MKPKASLNKFGEFTSQFDAARRRTLVQNQVISNPAGAPCYRRVVPAIFRAGLGSHYDATCIGRDLAKLKIKKIGESEWEQRDRENTILALKHWPEIVGRITFPRGFDELEIERGAHSPPKIEIGGLIVSVRPDLIIRGVSRGQKVIGAVKFHASKNKRHQLSKEGGQCVTLLTSEYLKEHLVKEDELVRPELCFSVDLFSESIVTAPKNQKQKLNSIAASAEEFALRFRAYAQQKGLV